MVVKANNTLLQMKQDQLRPVSCSAMVYLKIDVLGGNSKVDFFSNGQRVECLKLQ
jgi:hypothetical protein